MQVILHASVNDISVTIGLQFWNGLVDRAYDPVIVGKRSALSSASPYPIKNNI